MAALLSGIALLDFLGSHGQDLSITDTVTTGMTINATTNVTTECFEALDSSQTIEVKEGPITADQIAALNAVCAQCQDFIKQVYDARQQLESEAQQRNLSYNAQEPNPEIKSLMITGAGGSQSLQPNPKGGQVSPVTLGPCSAVCADIVLVGITQQTSLKAKQTCTVTNDLTTNIQQSINGQISAYLKNQQDIIGQLESAFTSNTESIAANLSTTMSQSITTNFTEELTQAMYATQLLTVRGNSILASNVSQTFTGSMVGTLNVNNTVNDQLRQSATYSITQSLLNKNDTIGDLSTDFLQVINTVSQMMEQLATQILVLLGAVIAAIMLVVGSLYVFNKNFHSWASNTMSAAVDAKITHFHKMQTDPEYRAQVAQETALH